MILHDNINFIIKKNRLKVLEFSHIIGVSEASAGGYARGSTLPKIPTLIVISEKFNATCDQLLKVSLSKLKSDFIGVYNSTKINELKESETLYQTKITCSTSAYKNKYLDCLEENRLLHKEKEALLIKVNVLKNRIISLLDQNISST